MSFLEFSRTRKSVEKQRALTEMANLVLLTIAKNCDFLDGDSEILVCSHDKAT